MKHFANRMAAYFSVGPSTPTGRLQAADVRERQPLSVSTWDEVLAAAMSDENARTFLDHLGPRWA